MNVTPEIVLFHVENKIIRPMWRASALSKKSGRQTDKQSFFKKTFEMAVYSSSSFSIIQKHEKRFKKPLKQFCDGRTDQPTDQKVAYRVA